METKLHASETNLINLFIKEHPKENILNNGIVSSLLEKQIKIESEEIISELSVAEEPLERENADIEDEFDFSDISKREDLEKILAASISLAKERNQLPNEIAEQVDTSQGIASNAFECTTIIEAIQKTISGDFSVLEQLSDYLIDMATVKTIAIADVLVEQGVNVLSSLVEATAYGSDYGKVISFIWNNAAPVIQGFLKIGINKVLHYVSTFIKEKCHDRLESLSNLIKQKNSKEVLQNLQYD